MTHEQEMLARAMNHIDDDMILAAHSPRKNVRRVIPVLVAACLIAVLAVSFPYLRTVINTNSNLLGPGDNAAMEDEDANKPEEQAPYIELGRSVTLGGSTLTLTHTTDTTATFTMVKTDDIPVYAILYDRRGDALATTEPDYKDNGVTIRPNTLRLYVNGSEQPTYRFPTAPGTYEITVDFTSIRNGQYPMQECMGFYAYIGKDDAAETLLFSLEVTESTTEAGTETQTDTTVGDTETE